MNTNLEVRKVEAMERLAIATENMLKLAEREEMVMMEPGPTQCPGCGVPNPEITQLQAGSSGRIDEYVLIGETKCCNRVIYAVPTSFSAFTEREHALAILNEKRRA